MGLLPTANLSNYSQVHAKQGQEPFRVPCFTRGVAQALLKPLKVILLVFLEFCKISLKYNISFLGGTDRTRCSLSPQNAERSPAFRASRQPVTAN